MFGGLFLACAAHPCTGFGYAPEEDSWEKRSELVKTAAKKVAEWEALQQNSPLEDQRWSEGGECDRRLV